MHNENYLIKSETLEDIADAIREKKDSEELIAVEDFATEIENLPSGADLSEYFSDTITSGSSSNPGYINTLKKLPGFVNSGNSCSNMFYNYKGTNIDLSSFATTNVSNMERMFNGCVNVTTLDLSNFVTINVTTMRYMFASCSSLIELDLSNFATTNVSNMEAMFYNCSNLQKLDIRNFTFDSVTSYASVFDNMYIHCLIIVKSQAEKDWVLARRSNLTNVKTVAEYEAE